MNPKRLETLIEEYKRTKSNLNERQKAELENEIWFVYGTIQGTKKREERRAWFVSKFEGTQAEYDHRQSLINAGKEIDPIWRRLNKGMARHTAIRLFREARQRFHSVSFSENPPKDLSLLSSIDEVLKEYDKIEFERRTKDGKIHRASKPYSGKPAKNDKDPINNAQKFFQHVRVLTDEFLKERLKTVDPYFAKELSEEYVDWIREGYNDLRKKVLKHRADAKKERVSKIGRIRFQNACEILAIRGIFGKPIDLMGAKKSKMQRVKQLHPDKNDGSRETEREFQSVVEAYDLLEAYSEQLGEV